MTTPERGYRIPVNVYSLQVPAVLLTAYSLQVPAVLLAVRNRWYSAPNKTRYKSILQTNNYNYINSLGCL